MTVYPCLLAATTGTPHGANDKIKCVHGYTVGLHSKYPGNAYFREVCYPLNIYLMTSEDISKLVVNISFLAQKV